MFYLPNKNNKIIRKAGNIEIFYGDIRKIEDAKKAISNCDIVIHLAFTSSVSAYFYEKYKNSKKLNFLRYSKISESFL